jgi:hypothetical protein
MNANINGKLAKAPKGSVVSPDLDKLRVFQLILDQSKKRSADPAFTKLSFSDAKDPLIWPKISCGLLKREETKSYDYWGVLSSDFCQQFGMNGEAFIAEIKQNPGFDVYIANPHVEIESLYQNLWVQGEISHPKLLLVSQHIFKALGLKGDYLLHPLASKWWVTGNACVGSRKFWTSYCKFITEVVDVVNTMPIGFKRVLFQVSADPNGLHQGSGYFPFFVERLMSVFLLENSKKFKTYKIQKPFEKTRASVQIADLLFLKDAAIAQKSDSTYKAWANYRNLFLSTVKGGEWVKKNAKTLNLLVSLS